MDERHISLEILAKQSGIPRRTIEEWFYNDREPSLYKAEKVLSALGYKIKFEKEGGDPKK